jgi:hypothetical protein
MKNTSLLGKIKTTLKENKLPFTISFIGLIFPILILQHKKYEMNRLDEGIKRDFKRIEAKGKKYSDIPKSI